MLVLRERRSAVLCVLHSRLLFPAAGFTVALCLHCILRRFSLKMCYLYCYGICWAQLQSSCSSLTSSCICGNVQFLLNLNAKPATLISTLYFIGQESSTQTASQSSTLIDAHCAIDIHDFSIYCKCLCFCRC